jgi:glycosyltransferase involved in cell wall biosynthesis
VTASNQRRGAEVFAGDLIRQIGTVEHRLVFLRDGEGATLDYACPARPLVGARKGLPGVPRLAYDLRREISRWSPDVVQAHGGEAFRVVASATLGARVPVVYRRIGMAAASIRTGWRQRGHGVLIRRATCVVCVADAVRREVVERFGVASGRAVTIPNGVDPARLTELELQPTRARVDLGLPSDARVVLSLCALSWEKDPLGMLDVTAPILRGSADVRHVFAGDGPLRDALLQKVDDLGLERKVVVLASRPDVGRLLAATDVLLSASRPLGMEGMPAILIEAGLAARPVVAAAVPGVSEVVIDGETGVLAPPGDVEALRAGVQLLLDDRARRDAYGKAASARCEARFTIDKVAPRYVDLWKSFVQ